MTAPAPDPNALAWPLWLALAIVALAAIAVPLLVTTNPPHVPPPVVRQVHQPERIVRRDELPPVEPVAFQAVATDDARTINAAIPFVTGPRPAARPFRFNGSAEDRARAIDCLAAAVLYEAGDDRPGQEAVAQVVLNRVRHPAFPKSVCGVVFQGSERATGCQFTFTCDGALARRYADPFWERARRVAREALSGHVFAPVGLATHYHTDWVVPYWSASLDKVAGVDTHLFFRWTGWWGTPPAFNRAHSGGEPAVAKLAAMFATHRGGPTKIAEDAPDAAPLVIAADLLPRPLEDDPNSFIVALDPRMAATDFAALAVQSCGARPYCKFYGWTDKAILPRGVPSDPRILQAMSFSYLRDRGNRFEKALWNCAEFPRTSPGECMRQRVVAPAPARPALATPSATETRPGSPEPLAGVRRKSEPAVPNPPVVAPSPKSQPE